MRRDSVGAWIDKVETTDDEQTRWVHHPLDDNDAEGNKENRLRPITANATKKRKQTPMQDHDAERTPRPNKRQRDMGIELAAENTPEFSPSASRSDASSDVAELESHKSGRMSPTKQIQVLEDLDDCPIVFHNFDDREGPPLTADTLVMREAVQQLADGHGILAYGNDPEALHELISLLPSSMDRKRFGYPWAHDSTDRRRTGKMPDLQQVLDIVEEALECNRGSGKPEDEWNSKVHQPLLDLARTTSSHSQRLKICNVKSARIEPATLARRTLPSRVVDYTISLSFDSSMAAAFGRLQPLHPLPVKSFNHTTRDRKNPIAVHIETKSPMKSWTDGKPQLAIWTDAWTARLRLLCSLAPDYRSNVDIPASPLIIAQGHDWYLLIVRKTNDQLVIWEKLDIGGTATAFDAMKVLAVLHWVMEWAQTVWRPWFMQLIGEKG